MIESLPKDKKIILFDGVCNLCNSSINKVIARDTKDIFRFASLQSAIGIAIQTHLKLDPTDLDSVILYEPTTDRYYEKSSAALRIMNGFGGAWKLMNFFYISPAFLRNIAYNYIAKNRYKWYGKQESCMMPTPELKAKFL
ncbi:DCC1-like thiol-disulfide oxidoreductase family protein [uncultured Kordia sp.]|uniref:thiol-disulfide oxidoreductase DCC family protein n=1 Tax=uncultured Kordia sp. TaxID=507699 RepID=UPI00261ED9A5|nr:DCC1-like thiol-disulfide oxidoreductase family protein [uncultured Kordia sp.]